MLAVHALLCDRARVGADQVYEVRWFEDRDVKSWPRTGQPVVDHLEGVF